ncbi:MAG: PAS domain S-box protein, partial [Rhodospirillaceae bacterium]|nr:PAS domain S-box protein [Rhodospirillaceae bacterium]
MGNGHTLDGDAGRQLLDFARVFDHAPVGFCVVDLDLRFVYVNKALAALNGISVEGHIGRTIHDALPQLAPLIERQLRQVAATGEPVIGEVIEGGTDAEPGLMRAFQHTYSAIFGDNKNVIGLSCLVQDVTEQQRAHEALERIEERLELSLDAVSIGTWIWNLEDGTHFWDSRMLEMSGHSLEQHTGIMDDDFVRSLHPDDEARVMAAAQRSLDDDADYNIEYRIYRRDNGELRNMNARAAVIRDANGKAVRMTGIAIDVTEQKRTEAELRRSQALLERRVAERTQTLNDANRRLQEEIVERGIAEAAKRESEAFVNTVIANMVDALITIDTAGNVSSFNQVAEDVFGYGADEVIGQSINMLMPEPDHSRHDKYISDYMDTGRSAIIDVGPRDVLGRHKDGRALNLELAISRTSFGGQPLFIGALRDVSERKRLEELFQVVAENSPNSIILKDLEGRILLVNSLFETWMGVSAHEVVGRTAHDLYPADYADAANAEDRYVVRAGKPNTREWQLEFADGQMHRIVGTKFPVTDSNGAVIGVGTVGMDVTDLRAAESQLLQAQKMEAIGQLTGGIAHDFNNLLAIMMGNLSLLAEDLSSDHEAVDLLEPTMRAIDQAAALTARMLAFSRQQPLEVHLVDANALLRGMQPLIMRSLVEDVEVTFALASDLYNCQVDPGQLEQAILNLAINARDAMPQGGNLRIETANVTLGPDDEQRPMEMVPGDYVMISVSDDGEGIASAELDKIFDPFFTTKPVGEGTGLGLSMVYGFVKQSDGHITVASKLGAGTTFRIHLSADRDQSIASVTQETKVMGAVSSEIILVLEDEKDVQSMVATVLEKQGYQVLLTDNGRACLKTLAENNHVDLLLTDILLPGDMNGQQVADAAVAKRNDLKVLFMSGYPRDAIVDQGRLKPG